MRFIALIFALLFSCSAFAQVPMTGAGLGTPVVSVGPVTFGGTDSGSISCASGLTCTSNPLTITAGSKQVLILAYTTQTPAFPVTCTWNAGGQTFQSISDGTTTASENFASGGGATLLSIVAPTGVGSATTATCTWTGGSQSMVLDLFWVNGANQAGGSTTFPHVAGNTSASATTMSVNVASASGHLPVSAGGSAGLASAPTQTAVNTVSTAGAFGMVDQYTASPSNPTSFGFTTSAANCGIIAADIAP